MAPGADQILTAAATQKSASARAYWLQLMAHRLELVAGFDDLLALDAIDFTPFDYQMRAARTALRRFRGRGLLSDEVGLGKTIEAGLVLKEYLLRQMVQRVLILTPPGLVEQWREELATKFDIADFVTSNDEAFRAWGRGVDAFSAADRVAGHRAAPEHRQVITSGDLRPGHRRRGAPPQEPAHPSRGSWSTSCRSAIILLLTATPVQNSLNELYNLVTVLKPGQLKSPREFQQRVRGARRPAAAQEPRPAARAAERRHGAPLARPDHAAAAAAPARPYRRSCSLTDDERRILRRDCRAGPPHVER